MVQLVLELFGELLLELGLGAFQAATGRRGHRPLVAALGYLVLGALLGGVSLWYWPEHVLQPPRLPGLDVSVPRGLSVLVAPLAGGLAMHLWGRVRRARGHATTNLATFLGGSSLLFAYTLVRVLGAR